MRIMRTAGLAGLLLSGAACSDKIVTPTLTTDGDFQIRPAFVRLTEGEGIKLTTVAHEDGKAVFTSGAIEWLSLDEVVATVGASGVVTALTPGWARVVGRATVTGQSDTATVAAGIRLADLTGGADYMCGWTAAGVGLCWGSEAAANAGAFATEGTVTYFTPNRVAGSHVISDMSAGYQTTCAIADGAVYCAGHRFNRALGTSTCRIVLGTGCHSLERVDLTGTFRDVERSTYALRPAACASGPDGVACWGAGAQVRPAGTCSTPYTSCTPALLYPQITGDITVGSDHACGLDGTGRAFCWGDNRRGQLGAAPVGADCKTSACTASDTLIPVATTDRFRQLVGGTNFTCGLTTETQVTCWGDYFPYSSGGANINPPAVIDPRLTAVRIDAGPAHVCAINMTGELYCWGHASWSGALGEPRLDYGAYVTSPRRIMAPHRFVAAAGSNRVTCGISTTGATLCIGSYDALGQGFWNATVTTPTPIAPPGPLPDYVLH